MTSLYLTLDGNRYENDALIPTMMVSMFNKIELVKVNDCNQSTYQWVDVNAQDELAGDSLFIVVNQHIFFFSIYLNGKNR